MRDVQKKVITKTDTIMTERTINKKALYTPKGAAREYAAIGCNFYTGCPHGCTYCYLKRGAPSKVLGGTEVRLKKCFRDYSHALHTFEQEVADNLQRCRHYGIFFSFTTDPLIKETGELTIDAVQYCARVGVPVWLLTKNAAFLDDDSDFTTRKIKYLQCDCFPRTLRCIHIGFTLTGHDEMEPNASTNAERIEAMRKLHDMGFSTWASIEPVIDWESSFRMIKESIEFCDHYKIGLLSGVKKSYYNREEADKAMQDIVYFITEHDSTLFIKKSLRTLLNGE